MTQQYHFWAYTLRKPDLKETRALFIAALFIIARTWKQPRCQSADEWIRKLWYIYTMEYYSAVKKNSFDLHFSGEGGGGGSGWGIHVTPWLIHVNV